MWIKDPDPGDPKRPDPQHSPSLIYINLIILSIDPVNWIIMRTMYLNIIIKLYFLSLWSETMLIPLGLFINKSTLKLLNIEQTRVSMKDIKGIELQKFNKSEMNTMIWKQ